MTGAPDRLTTALAARYRLERELGAGGMATVYLAHDGKHDRRVALKVLRPELAAALGPERFLREITTTANLRHPHILPLYDSGQAGDFLFYVMPYVEGEALRDRLTREKQLPVDDALQIAREVADALSYAHSRGVIHRDIKPENILLEHGHAVVADFGIARAVDAAGGARLTETGLAIGTPTYMSPEQAAGERELDGRSDLYALGCVLYEMLAGQPPFTGPTVESVIRQHLTVQAPPVTNLRRAVSGDVASALQRALAKTPADRPATATQFALAITPVPARVDRGRLGGRRWRWLGAAALGVGLVAAALWLAGLGRTDGSERDGSAGAPAVGSRGATIAVLPFTVQGSPDLRYLREGIVNLLSTKLDGAGDLRSVDPGTLLRLVEREAAATVDRAVALRVSDAFQADYFVTGSLVEAGGHLQVSAVLYARAGSRELTRGTVEGSIDQLFVLMDDLTAQLLSGLSGGPAARVRAIAAVTTSSLPALKAFLEGEDLFRRAQFGPAVDAFARAVAEDSTFALAYYRLSLTAEWNFQDELAREAAEQAVRFDNHLAERDRRLLEAFLVRRTGANSEAAELYRSILGTHPDEAEAWLDLAEVLFHANPLSGRSFAESRHALERVLDFDPRHSTALIHLSRLCAYEQDLATLDSLVDLFETLNPDPGRRLELDALRAFASADSTRIGDVMNRLHDAGDLGVALAVWAAGVYSTDLGGAQRVAELLTASHRAPEVRRLGYAWLAHLDAAAGRWRSANARLDEMTGASPEEALEYRALLQRIPFMPVERTVLERLRRELDQADPSRIPRSANPSIIFTAHDRLHPAIRLYLLGLLHARLGDAAAARRRAEELRRAPVPSTAQSLGEDLARSVRAQVARHQERPREALLELEGARMATWYGQTMASPLYSQVYERFQRAELLFDLGQLNDAERWYATLVQTSPFELPYLAFAHLRRAEIAEQQGQPARAVVHYERLASLWHDADPELQPMVERARRRIEALR